MASVLIHANPKNRRALGLISFHNDDYKSSEL